MRELSLPHIAPIRFAQTILSKEENAARVALSFDELPSLGMMIEAAAQASASFSQGHETGGFLVSLKNVKLLEKSSSLLLDVSLLKEHDLGSMNLFSFVVLEGTKELVNGSFVIAKS